MKLKLSSKLNDIQISEIRQIVNLAKKDTINLGIGQLPFDPPAALIEAGIKSFQSGQLKYSPNAGLPELRELIALEHQSQTGKPTTFENVIITVGVESALYITFATFLDPDDEVLIPEIYFSVYDTIPKMLGAKVKTFKLNTDFSIDFQDLKKKITKKTKLIVINSPCNPTGKIVSLAEQQSLAD
ncbi:pyridoxal phosphate-dependent aminotransferase, partial [bacterium]|nr:pyridoxal phosphate-dependent aminotransferase [bacterium]